MVAQSALAGSRRVVHTAVALRVPKVRKTGNSQLDSTKEAERECMMALIDHMIWDSTHILPMYNLLQKRLASQGPEGGDGHFIKLSTVYNLPEDWIAMFITTQSDFDAMDIIAMKKEDEESLVLLLVFMLQLPKHLKLPECCSLKDFLLWLFKMRAAHVGNRLVAIKETMGFKLSEGKLNFLQTGCYYLVFDDHGCVITIIHYSKDTVKIDPAVHRLTRQYVLMNNHSDFDAALVFHPSHIRLADFFGDGMGPHKYTGFKGGKGKDWEKYCTDMRKQYDAGASRVAEDREKQCKVHLDRLSTDRRKEALKKARTTAQASMRQRKEKRKISLVV